MRLLHWNISGLVVLTFLFMTSCSGYKHKYSQSSVSLEKTPCFGTCPVYVLTINGNGNALLNNKNFTPLIGEFKQKFDPEEINELFKELASLDWANYPDEYTTYVSDLPGSRITFKHKRIQKEVYVPGGAEIPEELQKMITRLEAYHKKGEWSGEVQ